MAVTNVVMNELFSEIESGKVIKWLKREGDRVRRDEFVVEIEVDKTVLIQAGGEGVIRKIFVQAGEVARVGTLIAVIAEADEDITETLARSRLERGLFEEATQLFIRLREHRKRIDTILEEARAEHQLSSLGAFLEDRKLYEEAARLYAELGTPPQSPVAATRQRPAKCNTCGATLEADWIACPECQADVAQTCRSCGRHLKAHWRLCPVCKAPNSHAT